MRDSTMTDRLIDRTGSHRYPLLIKRLLEEG
jgi:hypothetical protein